MSHWPYLPFLLVWALPVIAIQWLVAVATCGASVVCGPGLCWRWLSIFRWRMPSLLKRVYGASLMGLILGSVPVEEALFYLLTATMVAQGFVIAWFAWEERGTLLARWRKRLVYFSWKRDTSA